MKCHTFQLKQHIIESSLPIIWLPYVGSVFCLFKLLLAKVAPSKVKRLIAKSPHSEVKIPFAASAAPNLELAKRLKSRAWQSYWFS